MKKEERPAIDKELWLQFTKAAAQNGESPEAILSDFMKDYIVSGGHPEQVANKWPWNKRTNTAKED